MFKSKNKANTKVKRKSKRIFLKTCIAQLNYLTDLFQAS